MEACVVAVRLRPTFGSEECIRIEESERCVVVLDEDSKVERVFHANKTYGSDADQETLFSEIVKPIIEKVWSGHNACIMAYGQTGSGKTHTMGMGINYSKCSSDGGLIPNTLRMIFTDKDDSIKIELSSLEVYTEEVYDLLSEQRKKLPVADFQATGAMKMQAKSLDECFSILDRAIANRHIGFTFCNERSSRSHAIFTIYLTQNLSDGVIQSKIHLVDLAGSEPLNSLGGETRREGLMINKGLHQLSNVMTALSNGYGHVPYRNSILTMLLKDCLSLKNFIAMIACINPLPKDKAVSVQTLNFAMRVSNIKTVPEVIRQPSTPIFKKPFTPKKLSNTILPSPRSRCAQRNPLRTLSNTIDSPRIFNSNFTKGYSFVKPRASSTPSITSVNHSRLLVSDIRTPMLNGANSVDPDVDWSALNLSSSTEVDCNQSLSQPANFSLIPDAVRHLITDIIKKELHATLQIEGSQINRTLFQDDRSPVIARRISEESPGKIRKVSSGIQHNLQQIDLPEEHFKPNSPTRGEPANSSPFNLRRSPRIAEKSEKISDVSDGVQGLCQEKDYNTKKVSRRTISVSEVRRSARLSIKPHRNYSIFEDLSPLKKFKKEETVPAGRNEPLHSGGKNSQKMYNNKILYVLQNGKERELIKLPVIGQKSAAIILSHRFLHGPIGSFKDLKGIKGLSRNFSSRFLEANNIVQDL